MNRFTLIYVCLLFCFQLGAQAFLNGGLEALAGTACSQDISNADFNVRIKDVTGLGVVSKLDLLTADCGYGVPREGNYFVGLEAEGGKTDAIAIRLDQRILSQNYYYLEFFARLEDSDTPEYNLALGINSTPNFHGELLATERDLPKTWRRYEVFFRAPGDGEYITVLIESRGKTKIMVDDFKMICPTLDLGRDTTFCDEVSRTIDLPIYFSQTSWSDGQRGNKAFFNKAGNYVAQTQFGNCLLSDTISFRLDPSLCNCSFELPNILSLNSLDNHMLKIQGDCKFSYFEMSVVDRWGNVVFQSTDPTIPWEGKNPGGQALESGVYVVLIRYIPEASESKTNLLKKATVFLTH